MIIYLCGCEPAIQLVHKWVRFLCVRLSRGDVERLSHDALARGCDDGLVGRLHQRREGASDELQIHQ